ncbi:MAG: agmatine deiminase family protein [Bacteroidetes bacterium]|nr:agmatine deiminase family protein [Bacteroidota bacterium]MCL2301964.1 agmatine deiminase family protein [Lentimicrobiaceae bacterium]
MKKISLLFTVLITSVSISFSQPIYNEAGIRLHHTPSQEEIEWAKSKGYDTLRTAPTSPPVGQIRPIAEWEPMEAVLIRYPFGIPMSLIREMAKDIKVITIVASTSQQNTVLGQYNSNGVNTANCEFLIASSDTYWTRDYGPWFMAINNNEVAMYDFAYNRPRPSDNQINSRLATYLSSNGPNINRYASTLQHCGGNFMNDGLTQAASTTLTLTENSGWSAQQIKNHFQEYMGIEEYHFIPDPIVPYDNIQHIDCWSKYLAPDKVLVSRVPTNNPNYNKFETAANYFASLTSSYGTPMQVFRVDAPGATGYSPITPYTNSLILNNKVLVPVNQTMTSHDIAALQVYQQAMPGYEIIGINYNSWLNTDALHCRTHEIADRCMLYVKHQPYFAEIENTGSLTFSTELYSYCNNTIYSDSAIIYLRIDGGDYEAYNMEYAGANTWEVTIYGLTSGLIEYYVFAADESGRRECHPYIGAPDPHKFTLVGEPPLLPVLSLDKTSSSVTSEDFEIIEDFITLSNLGLADLSFEITDIDFHEMLIITPLTGTIQPSGSQTITLSYDFSNVATGSYLGSFTLLSNDPENPEIEIALHATQNEVYFAPVLSLSKTSSFVYSEEMTVVEDFIIVYNLGNADLAIEIIDIDFDDMLSIDPQHGTIPEGDSLTLTLSYNFNNIAKATEHVGNFTLSSNDPSNSEVEISLHATLNLGINETDISGINIYPNPTTGELTITISDYPISDITILDVFGRKVGNRFPSNSLEGWQAKPDGVVLNISHLHTGIYFVKITADSGHSVVKKILKL